MAPEALTLPELTAGTVQHLRHEDFVQRAEAIIRDLNRLREEWGLREAQNEVWDRYVGAEDDANLRRFSEVVADARRQVATQRQLDEDRERLHHGHLRHDELVSVGHHYEMLRHQACIYNHLLRSVVEHHRTEFGREELIGWLTSASQGAHDWAKGEVAGCVSEVALHAALVGLPDLREVRYGTVEEDLRGYDFLAQWQGDVLSIDAKTGFYRPLSERKHGHRHLEISVPRESMDEFQLTRKGLDVLRREVRQGLEAFTGRPAHQSHFHYNRHSR
jgi:hypothetical protein